MDGLVLLRTATLAYVAVLVLAVAASLVAIAAYLWRIASTLRRVQRALVEVRDRTAPLRQHLGGLERLTRERVRGVERATVAIERAVGITDEAEVLEEAAADL